MTKILFLLLILPSLAFAETKVTGAEISSTSAVSVASITISNVGGVVISTFSATLNGFTYLPGGILMQWVYKSGTGATGTITLPKSYNGGQLHCICAYDQASTPAANAVAGCALTGSQTLTYYNASAGSLSCLTLGVAQ